MPSGPMQKPKRQSNTFPFFSDGLARSRTAQEKVVALEQQVLMLTKELKSQKVSPSRSREPRCATWPLILTDRSLCAVHRPNLAQVVDGLQRTAIEVRSTSLSVTHKHTVTN